MAGTASGDTISTHSLTRRLTENRSENALRIEISTHSLTRRLTADVMIVDYDNQDFNSQPHKEADSKCINSPCYLFIFQLTASQGG